MAYDKAIETIIQGLYVGEKGLISKRMFGGVCYLFGGNMAFGIYRDYQKWLDRGFGFARRLPSKNESEQPGCQGRQKGFCLAIT